MLNIDQLRDVVIQGAQHWNAPLGDADPNTYDVYFHARAIEGGTGEGPPANLPSREIGVKIVEAVEENLISGSRIRLIAPVELGGRCVTLIRSLQGRGLISCPGFADMYVASLHAWHGCLGMAKNLRETYVTARGEVPYTPQVRWDGYNAILSCAQIEERRGNKWVRFGMSLARLFEKGRGKIDAQIHDNWVPQDSPYWQG